MTTLDQPLGARAIAPDLARGLMLLLIALANVSWFLYGPPTSGITAHRPDAAGLDAAWQVIAIIAIDGRSYPLFAFLFGYGIWQLHTRQRQTAGRTLRSRHLVLLAFGAVHAALLWHADVLGAYGLIGLIAVRLFLPRPTRTLLRWAGVLAGVLTVIAALALVLALSGYDLMPAGATPQTAAITPYVASILPRLQLWVVLTVGQGVLGLVVPIAVLLAIACARHRVLESPEAHRPLLVRTALAGIAIGWAGAVPSLIVQRGLWDVPAWTPMVLGGLTGLFAALGYVALFALLAARISTPRPRGPLVRGLTATGERSLSCYLLQSVVFAPLLCAWGAGLGGVLDQWQAALVAVATWLVSIAFAVALDRAGTRGPAERLLRTLSRALARGRSGRGRAVAGTE